MSKPLELTIYPRPRMRAHYQGPAPYLDIESGTLTSEHAANMLAGAKRLTEAELCAEYWRHEGDYRMLTDGYRIESFSITDHGMPPWATETLERNRVDTLMRFATHSHYIEATEPESDTE